MIPSLSCVIRGLIPSFTILVCLSAEALPAWADSPDCRLWNPDNHTPSECRLLIDVREMQHVQGNTYGQTDNLFELFVVLGPHDELTGVQYIKNRGRGFGPGDRDHDGAPRLAFVTATVAQLEAPGGVVVNPNHQAVKLGLDSGFTPDRGGSVYLDYLIDGATGRRASPPARFHLGHDAHGDWALSASEGSPEFAALNMFTNYGIFGMVIGVRDIEPVLS